MANLKKKKKFYLQLFDQYFCSLQYLLTIICFWIADDIPKLKVNQLQNLKLGVNPVCGIYDFVLRRVKFPSLVIEHRNKQGNLKDGSHWCLQKIFKGRGSSTLLSAKKGEKIYNFSKFSLIPKVKKLFRFWKFVGTFGILNLDFLKLYWYVFSNEMLVQSSLKMALHVVQISPVRVFLPFLLSYPT